VGQALPYGRDVVRGCARSKTADPSRTFQPGERTRAGGSGGRQPPDLAVEPAPVGFSGVGLREIRQIPHAGVWEARVVRLMEALGYPASARAGRGRAQRIGSTGNRGKDRTMGLLGWALVFLLVALIAAAFGFGGISVAAAGVAKVLFIIFVVIFVVLLIAAFLGAGAVAA